MDILCLPCCYTLLHQLFSLSLSPLALSPFLSLSLSVSVCLYLSVSLCCTRENDSISIRIRTVSWQKYYCALCMRPCYDIKYNKNVDLL